MSLKDFFIEKNEPEKTTTKKPVAQPTGPLVDFGYRGVDGTVPGAAFTGGSITSGPDADTVASLNAAADASKKPGYALFKSVFDSLAGVPDAQRYSMALNVVKNVNKVDPTEVVASLDDRIALVQSEKSDFDAAYTQQQQQSVVGGQQEAAKIEAQIEDLKQQIAKLEAHRVEVVQQTGQAQVTLEQSRASFNSSYDVVLSALKREHDNISSFIPVAK